VTTGVRREGPPTGADGSAPATAGAPGQGLVELGLILAIAMVVAILAVVVFGPQLAAILDYIGAQVERPT
jgi:hypothetical protein